MGDASTSATRPLNLHGDVEGGSDRNSQRRRGFCTELIMTMGPGLMVCLADTDGSCLITAADSGSQWRYKLLMLQVVLIPTLYLAQELSVRLALSRGKGLTALMRVEAGPKWGWLIGGTLLVSCFLALISEITVIGQTIQACWGVPPVLTNTIFVGLLFCLVLTGSYKLAERVGLAMGCLQVFFFATMFMNRPKWDEISEDLISFPLDNTNFVKLVTANIGAVIMPWMLAYQQSALCEKGVTGGDGHLFMERIDTAVGSFLTQGVMAAMLITVAAAPPPVAGSQVSTVEQLLDIFANTMGSRIQAKFALTFAICGACIVAAIVVTLAGAWALEEAMGRDRRTQETEEDRLRLGVVARIKRNVAARPVFYCAYTGTCFVAWIITVVNQDFAVALTGVWTQFINGILMPPVVFAMWYLAAYKLPEEYKLSPCNKVAQFIIYFICSAFCLISIPFAIQDAINGN